MMGELWGRRHWPGEGAAWEGVAKDKVTRSTHIVSAAQMNSPNTGAGARLLALELFICKGAPRKDCLGAVRVHGPAPGVRKRPGGGRLNATSPAKRSRLSLRPGPPE
jgi:hypothetical protein